MKAYSCCSGGVMFVPEEIERGTNKGAKTPSSVSYKEIAGAEKKPLREKIFGVFIRDNKKTKVA